MGEVRERISECQMKEALGVMSLSRMGEVREIIMISKL
jgi:hypothetical protein